MSQRNQQEFLKRILAIWRKQEIFAQFPVKILEIIRKFSKKKHVRLFKIEKKTSEKIFEKCPTRYTLTSNYGNMGHKRKAELQKVECT